MNDGKDTHHTPDEEAVMESIAAAHVNEFADHLPQGLDTPAGET